jgi:hypothetical protein
MTHYRVIRAYGQWSKGHVFTAMQGNEARTLVARGLLEEVKAEPAKKAKGMRSPADRMMASPISRA